MRFWLGVAVGVFAATIVAYLLLLWLLRGSWRL